MASTPPEWHVGPQRPRHRTLWSDLARAWAWLRGLPVIIQLALAAVAVILAFVILSSLFGGDGDETLASRSTTSVRRTIPTTTSTTRPLPEGDDRTVKTVLDGDSFEITDGTKIRLIGIDAPDTEVLACFSNEATAHLRELLPADRPVRLVYDTTRTDRFGRTLAYVYRLSDGLFINEAQARDGFATELTTGADNRAHADEIATAVSDARNAQRGLWGSCQTTSTSSRPATTQATGATTTTEAPATTSSTVDSSTTTTVPGQLVVEQGVTCLTPGATAVFSNGAPAVCSTTPSDPFPKWRPA